MRKPSFMRNILVKFFIFCVVALCLRFAYVVTIRGESCDIADFCFFSLHENLVVVTNGVIGHFANLSFPISSGNVVKHSTAAPAKPKKLLPDLWSTGEFQTAARFYKAIFQDLISEGFLSSKSKTLCVETEKGTDVYALKELGVSDSIGVFKKALKPLVISGQAIKLPFKDDTFDFVFSGGGMIEKAKTPVALAVEVARTLKPKGFLVIHTGYRDTYSFNSLLDLFNCCGLMKSRTVDGFDPNLPYIHEIVMKKEFTVSHLVEEFHDDSINKCSVPGYKRELIRKAENLIQEEPEKPWITLKKNIQNVKYLPSMVDISFKERYVYVDVGSRSYGSSIVSWFKKQYPKHNRTFEIFAIEADKHFHEEYRSKKGVTLLPYAAWVRNESLVFEINHTPGDEDVVKGRGMGRIQPVQSSNGSGSTDHLDDIHGFDFAEWLKSTVSEKDFVVMKMDVEGTEFDLIPRLFETGAICLIDELFLECHYNRWQKCCPGERSTKYQKTYTQCLELFTSLRESGVLVHQWW